MTKEELLKRIKELRDELSGTHDPYYRAFIEEKEKKLAFLEKLYDALYS